MKRALVIVLDSLGIGHAPDAADFGDDGSHTVGHIRQRVPELAIPTLDRCGLRHAEALAAGTGASEISDRLGPATLSWGCMTEVSPGKDTTTGHWEIAGAPLAEAFATYESFPPDLVAELESAAGTAFIGNYAQSGTTILKELGEQHLTTGHPILYTSSDSVLQIAAHEEVIPLPSLYEICTACRGIADRERIGRVIARPFIGTAGKFERTANRKDFSLQPPETVLNQLQRAGISTVGIGKIADIFANSGIGESYPTKSNQAGMEMIEQLWQQHTGHDAPALYFANLVDFDMLYGHRRDVLGYARCLEEFDQWLGCFLPTALDGESLVIITADHGNDPTWRGTDHTREKVPLLVGEGPESHGACLGDRIGFQDVAARLLRFFEI